MNYLSLHANIGLLQILFTMRETFKIFCHLDYKIISSFLCSAPERRKMFTQRVFFFSCFYLIIFFIRPLKISNPKETFLILHGTLSKWNLKFLLPVRKLKYRSFMPSVIHPSKAKNIGLYSTISFFGLKSESVHPSQLKSHILIE